MPSIIQGLIVHRPSIIHQVNGKKVGGKEINKSAKMREIVHIQAGQCGNQVSTLNMAVIIWLRSSTVFGTK